MNALFTLSYRNYLFDRTETCRGFMILIIMYKRRDNSTK